MTPLQQRIVRELRKVSAPDFLPETRWVGICEAVADRVFPAELRYSAERTTVVRELLCTFARLGLDDMFPIGGPSEFNDIDDLWDGHRGSCRRLLASCAADQLEFGRVDAQELESLYEHLRELAEIDGRDPTVLRWGRAVSTTSEDY